MSPEQSSDQPALWLKLERMTDARPKSIPLQEELPAIIESLRNPAGDDPRFATLKAIAANRTIFTEKAHATWKTLHNRSLDEILTLEGLLSLDARKLPAAMVWYFRRCLSVWRRINDAIVWVLLGYKDHVIRTVCHRKDRPQLASANPGAIRKLLNNLNSDPMTIAIWSDATTCVDLGDIFCKSLSGKPSGFFEVKEGAMNDKIFELMRVKGAPDEIVAKIETFATTNGPKAMKQLKRVVRQQRTYNQIMDIIDEDRGYDPRREAEITIGESTTQLQSYDQELQTILEAAPEQPLLRRIDRCLWVYVDRNQDKSPGQKVCDFESALDKASPDTLPWMKEHFAGKLPFDPVLLEGNLDCPESIPLFLRPLKTETIRDVLFECLMHSAYLFLDWKTLGEIVIEQGAELAWSTFKEGRTQQARPKAQRLLTIGERIPRIQGEGNYIEGFSKLYRVFFDGITPSSVVAQYVEMLRAPSVRRSR
jgi:hypothetical protein